MLLAVNNNRFSHHGSCVVTIEHNIIVIDIHGPWNVEFIHHFHQQLAQAVSQLDGRNYAVLAIPYGEAIVVDEGLALHIEFLKQSKACAVAVCLHHCETPAFTRSMCTKIYKAAGLRHEFFDDVASAKHWLQQELSKPR